MKHITSEAEYASFLENNLYALIQFGTSMCAPCQAIEARLDVWNQVPCLYISTNDFSKLCAQNQVYTAPTLRFYRKGKCLLQVSGYFSLDEFLQQIQRILEWDEEK